MPGKMPGRITLRAHRRAIAAPPKPPPPALRQQNRGAAGMGTGTARYARRRPSTGNPIRHPAQPGAGAMGALQARLGTGTGRHARAARSRLGTLRAATQGRTHRAIRRRGGRETGSATRRRRLRPDPRRSNRPTRRRRPRDATARARRACRAIARRNALARGTRARAARRPDHRERRPQPNDRQLDNEWRRPRGQGRPHRRICAQTQPRTDANDVREGRGRTRLRQTAERGDRRR